MDALKANVVEIWWAPYNQTSKPRASTSNLAKAASVGCSVWQGLTSMFRSEADMEREMLIYRTTDMIQIWSDLTMMYQGDFKVLHEFYKYLR